MGSKQTLYERLIRQSLWNSGKSGNEIWDKKRSSMAVMRLEGAFMMLRCRRQVAIKFSDDIFLFLEDILVELW